MSPYTKGALFVIRLMAFGLIILGATLAGSSFFYVVARKSAHDSAGGWALKILPLLGGFVLWLKSGAIARKLTEGLDE